jgi:hypothetical protein
VNAETVNLYWFGPSIGDRVITLRPVDISLLCWIDCVVSSLVTGVPIASLYIGGEGYDAVTILVGFKEGVLN